MTNTNWWTTFFQGVAVDLWLDAVPDDRSAQEAVKLEQLLHVEPGAQLLDVPCGAGGLALPLAARGYRVTGVDFSEEFLSHAREADRVQAVEWNRRDMRDLPWTGRFDGAFCAGNSFGYLDDEGNRAFLEAVSRALKPGARFVLDTPMVIENLLGHIQDRAWWQMGRTRLLVANRYDAPASRLEIDYTFVQDGRVETRHGSHRAYSYRELAALLEASGFSVETATAWSKDAHSVQFIATRR